MGLFTMTRRTGALLAGVVPPGGMPLPQQTLGIGTWVGSRREVLDPALRAELLRLATMRRELRAGHLLDAVRIAMDVQVEALPDDLGATRTVAVLRSVGAAHSERSSERPEDLLRASLAMLGPLIPPILLDSWLAPDSRLTPEAVEGVCLAHDHSAATLIRLRVLLLRRAAQDHQRSPSEGSLIQLERRIDEIRRTPMHERLRKWAEDVGRVAQNGDLTKLIEAVGHNLALTDPKNGELHQQLTRCFESRDLDRQTQKLLARLSFSAWSTLRDAIDGTGAAELVSFSAQMAALRQVFEVLLERGILQNFRRAGGHKMRNGLLDAVYAGNATLGLGRWYGLLFASHSKDNILADALRNWFQNDADMSKLSVSNRLKIALGDLLQVRLHALPHDEEAARATAKDVLDTVARVGFGALNSLDLPNPGEGLVGRLVEVAK